MRIDDMCKTVTAGSLTFEIEWLYDDDPIYDWIGEYTDKANEGVIDRKEGVLYGGPVPEPEEPEELYEGRPIPPEPEDYESDELYVAACETWNEKYFAYREIEHAYDKAYDEWNDSFALEVLADGLATPWERNSYRFFQPYAGGEKVDSEHYEKYALQDYERVVGLERGDWCFAVCQVTLSVDGIELGFESLCGIESDSGSYIEEVEQDMIKELTHKIPEYVEQTQEVLAKLQSGDWEDA